MRQLLVELGISWVWMALESPKSTYNKLHDADVTKLTQELREHGIRVQGSTIIGLEHHTPDNIAGEIESAVRYQTDFHQFMLYTPVPGTPLHQQMSDEGRMLTDVDPVDVHGQYKFNFRHAPISRDDSKTVPGLGLLARFRTQRPQPLPHVPNYAPRLAAL